MIDVPLLLKVQVGTFKSHQLKCVYFATLANLCLSPFSVMKECKRHVSIPADADESNPLPYKRLAYIYKERKSINHTNTAEPNWQCLYNTRRGILYHTSVTSYIVFHVNAYAL